MSGISKPELLAPVCNTEALYGAIRAGADAVYLGGRRFGARAYAENLDDTGLLRAIEYVRIRNKKLYLTVNTLIKEKETEELLEFLKPLAAEGLHGVIVQDMGAVRLIRTEYPMLAIHASTQMAVTDPAAARLLFSRGVKRVVPARELSLYELSEIKKTGTEVEAFIHGAMCYSYSGLCLFSSVLGDRSGNRGRCAQACRLPYRYRRNEPYYPLSMRDMCAVSSLRKLMEAGIDSFKIEGRMKAPEYCAGVTEVYRQLIDKALEKDTGYDEVLADKAVKRLSRIYLRSEVCEGYFDQRGGASMVTLESPSYSGSDESVIEDINKRLLSGPEVTGVHLEMRVRQEEPAKLVISGKREGGKLVRVTAFSGEKAAKPVKRAMTEEDFEKHIMKLGDDFIKADSCEIDLDEAGVFMPVSAVNDLRRRCVKEFVRELANG